jgi:hypothetical protein
MRNALVAEWIIARLTDRNRAVAIIGDLLDDTFLVLVDTVSRSRNFGNRRNHRDFFGWICAMAQAFVGRHVRNRIRMRWHPIRLPRNGIPGPDCALCCSRCGRGVVAIASDSRSYRRL